MTTPRNPFTVHHDGPDMPLPATSVQRVLVQIIEADDKMRATLDPIPSGYYWHGELVFEGLETHIRYTPRLRLEASRNVDRHRANRGGA